MPGLTLFTSNRLEVLVGQLAQILKTPVASPLDPETIVVQSKGMERWVSMELARRHGICANCRFPFPNAVVDEVFGAVLGAVPNPSPFDPAVMTWKIMRLLPACVMRPGFEVLRNYTQGDLGQLKQYQLARRIADLFDQYLVFRPEMMLSWVSDEEGEDNWQPLLWRELVRDAEPVHRAALRKSFLASLQRTSAPPPGLPQRLAIFGISALPPFHMDVFSELARFVPVNLFLLNPCREYWADIRSEQEMSRIIRRHEQQQLTPADLYLEQGNSLLASMGKLGREFFQIIQGAVSEEHDLFEEPGEGSLLACIQTDILHLAERDRDTKTAIAAQDRSIALHACHSPMRAVEVLYDQLLALFQEEPDLGPQDVLVMTPDINAYAPFIHAVFDAPEQPALKIPFSIADRSMRRESQIMEAFLGILDLVGSRLGAPQVLALLESSALRRRFDLGETDVLLIHRWADDTRIRWGADEKSRAAMGFGSIGENSWRAGLDRLLLGYALPGGDERLFQGVLPYDHIEGGDAAVLGRLVEWVQSLFADVAALARPRSLAQWAEVLTHLLEQFFVPDADGEREAQTVRQVLNDLASKEEAAAFTDPVTLEVIRSLLGQRLETAMLSPGFITGGVTFCAMLPMRSIPFQVICLLGMDDGAFPRQSRALGFDLMARTPRAGDRSQRNDDRYLFLEALLSARRRFYLSYVGQSLEDNSPLPPSVLVCELLDAIGNGFTAAGGGDIVERLTTRHRLQPFSLQYFKGDDARFFSYSAENCQAGEQAQAACAPPRLFIAERIDEPEEEWLSVDVDQLAAFFTHPAKFLLQRRLRIQLEIQEAALEDREIFELVGLKHYQLAQQLLERRMAGYDLNALFPVVKASGRLPHGAVGACRYDLLAGSVESFYAAVEPFLQAAPLPPQVVDLQLPPFQLSGRIGHLNALGLLHFRSARLKAKDHLNVWVRHLVRSVVGASGQPLESFLIGKDGALRYTPVEPARETLNALLSTYWEGLRRPLHFFPQTSLAFALKQATGKSREEALKAARNEWRRPANAEYSGESEDPYLQLCFGRLEVLDEAFEDLALRVFQPLLEHQSPVE
jgi:exodeoxyribonuclease V gamma subunit